MEKIRCIYAVLANKIIRCIFLCSCHCLYKSFWKGFESDQRRLLNNIAGYQITGSPSSKYEHRRASALLRNIQNTRRCGSVYLGVVVLRIWYFEHALLQLNNCHHILPEKINHLLYLFAEPHSLYSMSQSTTIILSFHDNVWKYAQLQCRHAWSQIAT